MKASGAAGQSHTRRFIADMRRKASAVVFALLAAAPIAAKADSDVFGGGARKAASRGAVVRRPRQRKRLQDLLSINRHARRAGHRVRHGDHSAGTAAARPASRSGLGASDDGRRSPLRAFVGAQALPDDCWASSDAGARLCRRGDGLSGSRHAGDASLSGRRQRGPCGDQFGARRARRFPDADAGSRYVVWGHSQGGQASLFTGLLSQSYAPDLQLLGVAAAAPATELQTLMDADIDTSGGRNLTAMTLWSWERVYQRADGRRARPLRPFPSSTGSPANASSRSSTSWSGGRRKSRSRRRS